MSKVRIYELAKETGLPNQEVIRRLSELGITARSHSSTVESVDATRFRESLGRIAIRYRTTRRKLMELNNITDPNKILIGQRLKVPKP